MRRSRSFVALSTLSTLSTLAITAASSAGAQGLSSASGRVAPQMVSYKFKSGGAETKVSELAVPFAFAFPLTPRLSFDLATAFANASVDDGTTKSTISGLTDTQLRLNYTMANEAVVITAGLNVPSGKYKVEPDKIGAAQQIGNDFLAFPVSSFGNGFGGTGGVAFAKPVGTWNLGLGASFRKTTEFDAYQTSSAASVQFTPATEMRFRAGLDRAIAEGRMILGLVFSKFGDDACTGCESTPTTYSTGSRVIGQAAVDLPVGEKQLYVGGWVLHHAKGEALGGESPSENIENVLAALGLNVGNVFLEPSVEIRKRQVSGAGGGSLMYFGARTKFQNGSVEFSPSLAYATGSLDGGTDISGFKGGLTIRIVR